jgi:uncharacterized protein (DUF58 family)
MSFVDPAALMRIKSLELRARVIMEGFLSGIHRSPFHGFSVEFTEYREYSPGDDTRHIDWRHYARSDRMYIKRYEDETNLRCYFLVDESRSMSFTSLTYTKAEYAATIAATLSQFLFSQGDATGLFTFDDTIQDYLPARNRPGHLRTLMLMLEKQAEGKATDLEMPLRRISDMLNKRSLIVLISDLLTDIDTLEKQLGYLRARGHDVIVFQTFDPAEIKLDFKEAALFQDLETGEDLLIEPALARKSYQEKMEAHQEAVRLACSRLGVDHHQFQTDQALELILQEFVIHRSKRKTPVRRV